MRHAHLDAAVARAALAIGRRERDDVHPAVALTEALRAQKELAGGRDHGIRAVMAAVKIIVLSPDVDGGQHAGAEASGGRIVVATGVSVPDPLVLGHAGHRDRNRVPIGIGHTDDAHRHELVVGRPKLRRGRRRDAAVRVVVQGSNRHDFDRVDDERAAVVVEETGVAQERECVRYPEDEPRGAGRHVKGLAFTRRRESVADEEGLAQIGGQLEERIRQPRRAEVEPRRRVAKRLGRVQEHTGQEFVPLHIPDSRDPAKRKDVGADGAVGPSVRTVRSDGGSAARHAAGDPRKADERGVARQGDLDREEASAASRGRGWSGVAGAEDVGASVDLKARVGVRERQAQPQQRPNRRENPERGAARNE